MVTKMRLIVQTRRHGESINQVIYCGWCLDMVAGMGASSICQAGSTCCAIFVKNTSLYLILLDGMKQQSGVYVCLWKILTHFLAMTIALVGQAFPFFTPDCTIWTYSPRENVTRG